MKQIQLLVSELPLWLAAADMAALLLVLAFAITVLAGRLRLRKEMRDAVEGWNRYREKRPSRLPLFLLDLFAGTVEKRSLESGVNLLEIFGIQERLIAGMSRKGRRSRLSRKEVRRALTFCPDRALFPVFLAAMRQKRVAAELENWLEGAGELFVLRRLAVNSGGTPFDGAAAARLLLSRLDEVRALADDTDYRARLFALRIIAAPGEDTGAESAMAMLTDGHPEVRRMAASLIIPPEEEEGRTRFREALFRLITDDPSYEVRATAAERLFSLFPGFRMPGAKELAPVAAIRLAEQLHPERIEDQELAFRFLLSPDPELSLIAARFLDGCGSFARLFAAADSGDREGMQRIETILKKGIRSHCFRYLDVLTHAGELKPASLLIASRILLEEGDKKLITALLEKALALRDRPGAENEAREILLNTMKAAAARGNEDARRVLGRTLEETRSDAEIQRAVLEHLPGEGAEELTEHLFALLADHGYPEEELLVSYIAALPAGMTVHRLLDMARAGIAGSRTAGRRAVQILARRGDFAGIQRIIEQLPLLDMEEAARCGRWLEQYLPAGLEERIQQAFEGYDAPLRARLIAALPTSLKQRFRGTIETALTDREQEVRIAAAHALFENVPAGKEPLPLVLLHDPVPQVRESAARLAGRHKSGYTKLRELVMDPNEVEPVKSAALEGIAAAGGVQAAEFLLSVMEKELELEERIIQAAGTLSTEEEFAPFLLRMETAPDQLRERILAAFISAGEKAERALVSLLEQPEPVKSAAASALERTGAVERTMRRLTSRRAEERLSAAELLSRIGTAGAYRGIVLAVKDPSEPVRVEAVKALQKLKDARGAAILDQLVQDPVPRVRRYARWARERLEAEALG